MVRTVGVIAATLLVGLCMNGPEYNGSFKSGMSFNSICGLLAIPSALMAPVSWFFIDEPKQQQVRTMHEYLSLCWQLLRSSAMFYVVLFQFFGAAIMQIQTPALGPIKQYWACVQNLQSSLFGIVGNGLFVVGIAIVKRYFLKSDWRMMLLSSQVLLLALDMPFQFCTIFDVVRNQYFYLGETFLMEIPDGINFVVATFVIVEMADSGNEGLVYGLLTTTHNLGSPVGRAISNQLYSAFTPSLDDSSNYIADSPAFRSTVSSSFILSYGFALAAQLTLLLLPSQRKETQRRKHMWPRRSRYAIISASSLPARSAYFPAPPTCPPARLPCLPS